MPEIGEVHRIVHYCRKHLLGKRIARVNAQEDDIVFLTKKTGLTADKVVSSLTGRTVTDAKRHGKYWWLEMDRPPHLLMHFGMTGWMKFSHDETAYYKPMKERKADEKRAAAAAAAAAAADAEASADATLKGSSGEDWPPRFWKLELQFQDPSSTSSSSSSSSFAAAFTDARRFGNIRLIDCPASQMLHVPPLSKNGPDPINSPEVFTAAWLSRLLHSKRVPVKALLLDQANVAGIGNWVADEALYQARLHPEQYSNTLSEGQVQALHGAIVEVCGTACETLADSSRFPEHWIMRYRWGKGKKGEDRLPSGEKIVWITVGGRTSAVVPSVQKKTGMVAGGGKLDDEGREDENDKKNKKRGRGGKTQGPAEDEDGDKEKEKQQAQNAKRRKKSVKAEEKEGGEDEDAVENRARVSKRRKVVKDEEEEEDKEKKKEDGKPTAAAKKGVTVKKAVSGGEKKKNEKEDKSRGEGGEEDGTGVPRRRRSARLK